MNDKALLLGIIAVCIVGCGQSPEESNSESFSKRSAFRSDSDHPLTIRINEFVAANDSHLQDQDGDYSDWIELYNFGEIPVQLLGCSLSDDPMHPQKWLFPNRILGGGEYLLIFASGKDRQSAAELHTNFNLAAKGEPLQLIGRDGKLLDGFQTPFPKQRSDVSFGWVSKMEKGEKSLDYLLEPTPGRANTRALKGDVASVVFSQKRGFYETPFELSLSCRTAEASIFYTLDGSLPTDQNGIEYRAPLWIDKTSVLRAAAFLDAHKSSRPKTQSFIFPADVARQSPDGLPPVGFPFRWGDNRVDYGMDPKIVNDPRFEDEIGIGLKSLPSFSIVMNLDDLFDDRHGIYANPYQDGRRWERPCSIEYILPDASEGFQIDCGIRIRGGFSRNHTNPKHAFRLFFRDVYGPSKLRYPLFGKSGASEFDNLDLRTFQNYSWSMRGDARAVFMRDQFNRDLQAALGHPSARGEYCHLYINGHYWGLYNTCERPEASYGASYFGGKKGNYDVIKRGDRDDVLDIMATDGNLESWRRLWEQASAGVETAAAYQRLLGRHADGSLDSQGEVLLNPDNLIDYMFVIFYGGNLDAPVSRFMNNASPNNWYGLRNRKGNAGFVFFIWDAEHTLLEVNEDRMGPFLAGRDFGTSNPQWIWQQCLDNAEFRMRVADLAYKRFFNEGILTAGSIRARFEARAKQIVSAVVCESARWGDSSGQWESMNRDDHWLPEMRRIADEYIPKRSDIVLGQLFQHGLIPDIAPPKLQTKEAKAGTQIEMETARGRIYFTTDGSDPRRIGGAIASSAKAYSGAIALEKDIDLRARTWLEGEWSALAEADFLVKSNF